MPTYDYKCMSCENVQEEMHGVEAKPEIRCQTCGGICERQFTATTNFICDGPSQNFRIKDQMTKKNNRLKTKMVEREKSGEAVTKLSDIK